MINRFELRALGCVVVRDIVFDTLRAAMGRSRRIPRERLHLLAERARALQEARNANAAEPAGQAPRTTGVEAQPLAAFVEALVAAAPELYGAARLRARYLQQLVQAGMGCAGAIVCSNSDWIAADLAGELAFIFLTMALWTLATSVQLWRTYRVVSTVTAGTRSDVADESSPRRVNTNHP